ncbi:MAG: ATP-dependent sacrificial sulfur transferase LarE [Christensenella sp.]|nr:ATP-dependent sacrificial sulfur transferase LarE [Christensenella sp.]
MDLRSKVDALNHFFKQNQHIALGFSGGVDSAYLFYAAVQNGVQIMPYFVKTAFQPDFELQDAQRVSRFLKTPMTVITADILSFPKICANPPDRCYYCKKAIFGLLYSRATKDGFSVLIDGSNASDDAADRPGMRALNELNVRSPLRECGITKTEIRLLSKNAGLFTWNKPSYACLATRIATGNPISGSLLSKIEKAEDALFTLGFSDFRIRVYHDAARIQMSTEQMPSAIQYADKIITALSPYFTPILLDLEGRDPNG